MLRIYFFIFLSAFILLRPHNLKSGMIYAGDDWSYFAHSSAIAFGQFPHYDKEVWQIGKGLPFHPSGAGVLASPFVFLFSLIDRLSGSDIVLQRTAQNIPGSWSLFGFTFATIFYFLAGCSFLFYGLKKHVSERSASWAVILMVVFQGAPLFAFRRPVFSHIYEFFIQSFFVFILLTILQSSRSLKWKQIFLIGLAVGLTILVRYNNIFMALAWPVIFAIWGMKEYSIKGKALRVSVIYFMAAVLMIFFKFLPEMFVTVSGVDVSDRLLGAKLFSVFFQRLGHIFIGLDWGIIYTAPFLLIGLICLCFIRRETIVPFRWLSFLLLVNLAIIMQWMTQGGWYGYRYFIFIAFPLGVYPFALFLEKFSFRLGKYFWIFIGIIALFPFLSMICFEGNSSNLTLSIVNQPFDVSGWGNNTYQLEVWKTVLSNFKEFIMVFCKGVLNYIVYLFFLLFHREDLMPYQIYFAYVGTSLKHFFQTGIILSMPFIFYGIVFYRQRFDLKK